MRPAYLDRYPAKMVGTLADTLVDKYVPDDAGCVIDPFCGSNSILASVNKKHNGKIPVIGIDINPLAGLFLHVKMKSFNDNKLNLITNTIIQKSQKTSKRKEVLWNNKNYWFTPSTMEKYENLRHVCAHFPMSNEKMVFLFAMALSIRKCSRADQESPKPFISKRAIQARKGKHFDPFICIKKTVFQIMKSYGANKDNPCKFIHANVVSKEEGSVFSNASHVITSPPYINAQDYFRNFQLEMYLMEDMLPYPYNIEMIKKNCVGTEQGDLLKFISGDERKYISQKVKYLDKIAKKNNRKADVIVRYFHDMKILFTSMEKYMDKGAKVVIVCGDNQVSGFKINTSKILSNIMIDMGFNKIEEFSDTIKNRSLPPKRLGHKSLIKKEVISAYSL